MQYLFSLGTLCEKTYSPSIWLRNLLNTTEMLNENLFYVVKFVTKSSK